MAFVGFVPLPLRRVGLGAAGALTLTLGAIWAVSLLVEVSSDPNQAGHHDFFSFYSAALAIARGHVEWIYQATPLIAIQRGIFPGPVGAAGYMPYLNPPFAAALQLPLALESELVARAIWLGINLIVLFASLRYVVASVSPRKRVLAIGLLALTFPVYQALVEGQWSLFLLAGCLYALEQARRSNWRRAGLGLAVLAIKPPLLLMAILWLAIQKRWRTATYSLATVIAVILLTLPITGAAIYWTYLQFLGGVSASHVTGAGAAGTSTWEGAVANMVGFNGLFAAYIGQSNFILVDLLTVTCDLILVLTLAAMLVSSRHRAADIGWLTGAAFLSAFLLDPHLYAQDCVLLLIGLAALLPHIPMEKRLSVVIATAAAVDLSALDTTWPVQGFPAPHFLTACLVAGVGLCIYKQKGVELRP